MTFLAINDMRFFAKNNRDQTLDVVKGVAIILVIIGHTFQGMYHDYDDFLGFKIIYSFHMPLFVFVSGAVSSFWLKKYDFELPVLYQSTHFFNRVFNSFIRLVVPFSTWTLIKYLIDVNDGEILKFCIQVFNSPDISLWFLLCIFYCILFFNLSLFVLSLFFLAIKKCFSITSGQLNKKILLILILILWFCVKKYIPNFAGLAYLKIYFFYYILGAIYYELKPKFNIKWVRIIPYILFLLSVPFWHRISPHNLSSFAPVFLHNTFFWIWFKYLVPIFGIFIVFDIARFIDGDCIKYLKSFLIHCGSASLGIYAIHFYFLNYKPLILAALFISLFFYNFFKKNRYSRLIFLGEK